MTERSVVACCLLLYCRYRNTLLGAPWGHHALLSARTKIEIVPRCIYGKADVLKQAGVAEEERSRPVPGNPNRRFHLHRMAAVGNKFQSSSDECAVKDASSGADSLCFTLDAEKAEFLRCFSRHHRPRGTRVELRRGQ